MPEELFETFDDAGRPSGLVPRSVVHRAGYWHRSVHVFLFRPDGALYLQRRAADKDLCPDCWDLSVGEHLQPGEDYAAAALRGLREELGVIGVALQPLGGPHRHCLDLPALGIADHEIQATFSGVYAGPVQPDEIEVAEVRAIAAADLLTWVRREPEAFTPWLLQELADRPGLGPFSLA